MNKDIKILWVEDNIGDILLIKEAFHDAGIDFNLTILDNGEDAEDYLFSRGRYQNAVRPDVVIFDLNLPKKSGQEVISEMKTDSELKDIPLVVLTSSHHDQKVLEGYNPDKCLYLTKPASFVALMDMARQIESFWLTTTNTNFKRGW